MRSGLFGRGMAVPFGLVGLVLGLCVSWMPGASAALGSAPVSLDRSFGTRGSVVAQIVSGQSSLASALALQPDGKVVVGGYSTSNPADASSPSPGFAVRLRPDGRFDATFGKQGIVTLPGVSRLKPMSVFGETVYPPTVGVRVSLTADGQVLVLGTSLARLDSNGNRDQGFGSGGTVALPASFSAYNLAPARDGSIVVVGTLSLPDRTAGAVLRLTASGRRDPSFGQGGIVTLPLASDEHGQSLTTLGLRGTAVLGNGRILVGGLGHSTADIVDQTVLARLLPDGSLDPAFGQAGQEVVNVPLLAPTTLLILPDGRFAIGALGCRAGLTLSGCGPYIASFDANGQSRNPSEPGLICSYCDLVGTVSVLPDSGFLISQEGNFSGIAGGSTLKDPLLLFRRFDASLHSLYGFALAEARPVPAGENLGMLPQDSHTGAITLLQPDGKILIAGSAPTSDGTQEMLVTRLLGLRARIVIPRQRARRNHHGLSVLIRCTRIFTCRGQATLRHRVTLAQGRFNVPPGHQTRITLRLSALGRAALRAQHPLRATLTLTPSNGTAATATVVIE